MHSRIIHVVFCGLLLTAVHAAQSDETPLQLASLDKSYLSTDVRIEADEVLRQLDQRLQTQPTDYEASLLKALLKFKSGDRAGALHILDALIKRAPDFHLAYLVRGDLLLSQIRPVSTLGQNSLLASLAGQQYQTVLQNLRDEARVRLRVLNLRPYENKMPGQILALADSVKNALLVDKTNHRLYLYQRQANGELQLQRDYYVSTGKLAGDKRIRGDLRTPEGVYFVTSWIPPSKLPDKYGIGAFPVNYPNELDRHQGKTGNGIWLHGTESDFYSRPPLDSEGCVVLTNVDLQALKQVVTPGVTPVIITPRATWVTKQAWRQQRQELLQALEAWRRDWQSLDVERYLSHYADDFWARGFNLASWKKRKRMLAKSKTYQRVRLSDISLLAYPTATEAKQDIVVARFRQSYQSNNFSSDMQKRLYLKRQGGEWRIVYEGR